MLGVEIAAAVSLVVHCGPATPAGSAVPDISPDGLEVAYTIPREESAEIEVARPGTVSPRTRWLTLDSAPEKLVWSARGRVLAFQKRTGAIEVLSFGRPSISRELVHVEHGTTTELGDWAPDGRQLVFARDGHIHTLDVATGDIRYLTDGLHPTWAPDGLSIAYAAGKELREISPDRGPPRTIASADFPVAAIAWSPDSTRLAFLGGVLGIVTRFGGRPAYTVAAETPLAWRPNGIFYSFEVALADGSVRRFDPETGKTMQLTHLPPGHDASFVAVSHDGTRVLYRLEVRDLPAGVRVVDGNGRQDRPVLACHGTNKPDVVRGSRLNDVIRVNGGGPDRVTCGPGEDVVYADRRDRVARDCERVKRSL